MTDAVSKAVVILKKEVLIMKKTIMLACIALLSAMPLLASDSSDAENLRKKYEKEVKALEICAANFGDVKDKSNFDTATQMIKKGKLEISQSKYVDAIATYKDYAKLQNEVYTSLAAKYLERTKTMNDAIAAEMVDSIDNPKVSEYLKSAYRNYEDAKIAMTRAYPVQVIDACRRAKKFSIGVYGLLKKTVPATYAVDVADNDLKIAGAAK
jgi:hypothetical protein